MFSSVILVGFDMAIYSCNLSFVSRKKHQPGTAGAHIRYICRDDAEPVIMANKMPEDPVEARTWLDRLERTLSVDGRVIQKIRIALPRELSEEDRYQVVQEFMYELSGNHVPWFAAIHQTGKDAHNPHVHIAVHDRNFDTGKRVMHLSDNMKYREKKGFKVHSAVEWVRQVWEKAGNDALHRNGFSDRIDRRTLEAQGIDRIPTIHEGPNGQHINDNIHRPRSKAQINQLGRVIDYPAIDNGRTRREFNAQVINLNLERAARSGYPIAAAWAQFEKFQMSLDEKLESRLIAGQQKRTAQYRNAAQKFQARNKALRAEAKLKHRTALSKVQDKFKPGRDELQSAQRQEREALNDKQSTFRARLLKAIDLTGIVRRRQETARKALSVIHKEQRHKLRNEYASAKQAALTPLTAKYDRQIAELQTKRSTALKSLKSAHAIKEAQAEAERQQREADRERSRLDTEEKLKEWQRDQKEREEERGETEREDDTKSRGEGRTSGETPAPLNQEFGNAAIDENNTAKQYRENTRDDNGISDKSISKDFDQNAKDEQHDRSKDNADDGLSSKHQRKPRPRRPRKRKGNRGGRSL